MSNFNIQALMALSAANVANDLWYWESPLMGGADEPMPTYPAIEWTQLLTISETQLVVAGLEKLSKVMANRNVAFHEASDDAILTVLGQINPSKKDEIIAQQVTDWNQRAAQAVKENSLAVSSNDDIAGYFKTESFKGASPSDAIKSAIAKFGEAAITAYAVEQINSTKQWWDYADYLQGVAYEAADKAYTAL